MGYSVGGEIYITKPFDNDDLVTTIRELIEFG
jgi:DNA-binding response OmpR family regulator